MLAKLSNRVMRGIKLKDKVYEIRDTQLKGLLLRVEPGGTLTYYLQYARGKRIKLGHGDAITPDMAREIARDKLAEFFKGVDPNRKRAKDQTYIRFLENEYKQWLVQNLRTGEATFDRLKKSFPELHDLKLYEVNPFLIEKWRSRRQKNGMKPASINRELADLRACLNRAVQWELLEKHPLEKVRPSKLDNNSKPRYLTEYEEKCLRQKLDEREQELIEGRESFNRWRVDRGHTPYISLKKFAYADYLKPAALLTINTGLRRGELFGLKWSDIDFDQKVLTVAAATAKTGKTRHIPLNEEAYKILRHWKTQDGIKSLYIFSGKNGAPFKDLKGSWNRLLKKAEISDFRWHDLRHHFASKLVMAGVDLNTIRELLGHNDYKMTLRYAHLAPEHKAAAVSKLIASV